MTRIRYQNNNGILISKPLIAGRIAVRAHLDLGALQYKVVDEDTSNVVASDSAVSVQMLKLKTKKALIALGVVFFEEVRERD